MSMDVDGSFHEVIRLKTHVATGQPRFHAHTRTGVSLEKPESPDVKHQVNHSKRCKGDVIGRIINLSLGSPNRNTSYLRKLAHARSIRWRLFGEVGKFRCCRENKTISNVQRKLQFLNNITGFLQTTWASRVRNTWRASGLQYFTSKASIQFNAYTTYLRLACAFSKIIPSRSGALRPSFCEAPSYRPTFPSEKCRASDE